MISGPIVFLIIVVIVVLIVLGLAIHVVTQYEMGVQFRSGRVVGTKNRGLAVINADIRKILDVTTLDRGVEVTLADFKDIQVPETMKRATAKQAEAERERRAKIIAAEGESLAAPHAATLPTR